MSAPNQSKNLKVGVLVASLPVVMLGLAYAAVPLYAMFCQATGYGGTTQRVVKASDVVLERTVTVLFDANTGGHMPWIFEPVQRSIDVRLGENAIAYYRATNTSSKTVKGTATFNVDPALAADRDARTIQTIVLSYTFFPSVETAAPAAVAVPAPSAAKGT